MSAQVTLRNVSDQGDLEVPELGVVVEYRHEVTVDREFADRLLPSGNFVEVKRQSKPRASRPKGAAARAKPHTDDKAASAAADTAEAEQ